MTIKVKVNYKKDFEQLNKGETVRQSSQRL